MFNKILSLGIYARKKNNTKLINICSSLLRIIYGFQFSFNENLGRNIFFCYNGLGTVIHEKAVIGDNVTIAQNVTIGGRSKKKNLPIIGSNIYIGAGSIILGNIKIGSNVVIGAGSIVISDIPSNTVVAGSPAKIIKNNINDYRDYF